MCLGEKSRSTSLGWSLQAFLHAFCGPLHEMADCGFAVCLRSAALFKNNSQHVAILSGLQEVPYDVHSNGLLSFLLISVSEMKGSDMS